MRKCCWVLGVTAWLGVTFFMGERPTMAASPIVQIQYIMGTLIRIEVYDAERERAQEAIAQAFGELRRCERILSHYMPDSELMQALKEAHRQPVGVAKELFEILELSLRYSELSDGAFDVTIAPLIELWGFKNHDFRIPETEQVAAILALVGYKHIRLNPIKRTLYLDKVGVRIDFGAIGKGYAIDRAVAVLKQAGIKAGVIDAVSNQYFIGHPPDGACWKTGIKHPRKAEELLETLCLKDQAVSTSGDYEQFFELNGKRYSHILNPQTGYPTQEVVAATVVSPSSTEADALSTALLVLGEKKSRDLIGLFEQVYAIRVTQEGDRVHVLHLGS